MRRFPSHGHCSLIMRVVLTSQATGDGGPFFILICSLESDGAAPSTEYGFGGSTRPLVPALAWLSRAFSKAARTMRSSRCGRTEPPAASRSMALMPRPRSSNTEAFLTSVVSVKLHRCCRHCWLSGLDPAHLRHRRGNRPCPRAVESVVQQDEPSAGHSALHKCVQLVECAEVDGVNGRRTTNLADGPEIILQFRGAGRYGGLLRQHGTEHGSGLCSIPV